MFTILCDGKVVYSPTLVNKGYGVISPKVTKEVNRAGSVEFGILPSNPMYNAYSKMKSVITVEEDKKEIWRGRVLNDDRLFYLNKNLICEGELSFLNDVQYPPYDYSDGITITTYLQNLLNYYNSRCSSYRRIYLGNVKGTSSTQLIKATSTEYVNILSDISKNLVEQFEGYLVLRRDQSEGKSYLDYYNNKENLSLQTITFGVNLCDLSDYTDASNVYTRLIPLGKADQNGKRVDITSVNGGKNYVSSSSGESLFGIIERTIVYDDLESASELKALAEDQIKTAIELATTITIKAVDLHRLGVETDSIDVGQYVRVVSPPHGIDGHFLCSKIVLDLVNPENSEYTFGTTTTTISGSQGSVEQDIADSSQFLLDAIAHATAMINGAKGGYKLSEYDKDGKWLRDLYMNAPSKEQATQIMQVNMNGIGFSSDGYNGPYKSAWTIDGRFVADWITAGSMQAERVRGGQLLSNNYVKEKTGIKFDLNEGDLEANKFNLSDYLVYDGSNETDPFQLGGWQIRKVYYDGVLAEYWDTIDTQVNGIGATGPWVVWGGWNGQDPFNPENYKFVVTEDGVCKAMEWLTGSKKELKKNIKKYEKSGLQEVLGTEVYSYELANQSSKWKNDGEHIGFIIGDGYALSADITDTQGGSIDMYRALAVAYKAIQELVERIEKLEKERKER